MVRQRQRCRKLRQISGICRHAAMEGSTNLNGIDAWRALPAAVAEMPEKMLRDAANDLVREEVDSTPLRCAALLCLPVNTMPCVGSQCSFLSVRPEEHAALRFACKEHRGFIGCGVLVPKTKVYPRGCVGAEIVDLTASGNMQMLVTLRGVASLRIMDRTLKSIDEQILPLMQEVSEWTSFDVSSGGEARVASELEKLEYLFNDCGTLQERTGIWAAGDLASFTLKERTGQVRETMVGVTLSGLENDMDDLRLRATLTAYAAITAFKDSKLATFLTDPTCVLRRLFSLNKYLTLMQSLLRSRT